MRDRDDRSGRRAVAFSHVRVLEWFMSLGLLCVAFALPTNAVASTTLDVIPLAVSNTSNQIEWEAVNASNEVVGAYDAPGMPPVVAEVWNDGTVTKFPTPAQSVCTTDPNGYGDAIDGAGEIFGSEECADSSQYARAYPVYWSPAGSATVPYVGPYNGSSALTSASDNGNVAGVWCQNTGSERGYGPCQYVAAEAPTPPATDYTFATVPVSDSDVQGVGHSSGDRNGISINNAGEIAVGGGSTGVPSELFPGGVNQAGVPASITLAGTARELNDNGDVIGTSGGAPAIELASGTVQTLPLLNAGDTAYPNAINDSDEVVGFECPPSSANCTAVAWIGGEVMSLASMVAGTPAGTFGEAFDVNNQGSIVTTGVQNGVSGNFLLEPVNSPLTASIALTGSSGQPLGGGKDAIGETLTATVTITDTSTTDAITAISVNPPMSVSPAAALTQTAGPTPAPPTTLTPGQSASYAITYTVNTASAIKLSMSAAGTDDDATVTASASASLNSFGRTSTTTVACVAGPAPVPCTATVTDTTGDGDLKTPTGEVDFVTSTGSLAAPSCTLAAVPGGAACSINLTPPIKGGPMPGVQISVSYGGDSDFQPSSGTFLLSTDLSTTMTDNVTGSGGDWQDAFTISVANRGPSVTNVPVTDTLPPQLVYQSGGSAQITCAQAASVQKNDPRRGGGFVTCTIPTIGQNAAVTFTITAGFDNVSEPFDNVATVNPSQTIFETDYTNDVADAGTPVPLPEGQGFDGTWQKLQDQLGGFGLTGHQTELDKLLTGASKSKECVTYQNEILQRLDGIRESDPAALKGLSYGPVTDQGHNGVVVYLTGTSYYDTGIVIHGTAAPSGYDLPGRDILRPTVGHNVGTWLTGIFIVTQIGKWQNIEGALEGRGPVHELDTTYGYYFDGTYPATGTFLGASSGTCTFAPRAMVVSTRSPVDINLVNASGQQLQTTQQGTLALDQLPEPTTYYLGVDPAGYEDWDLVLPVDRYKVTLTGIATGSYTLTLTSFSASGTPIQTVVHGTTAPGQTSSPVAFSPPATVANRFRFTAGHAGDRIVLEVNVPGSGSIVAKAQTQARTSAGGAGRHPSGHGRTTIYGTASAAAHGKRRVRLVIRPGKAGRALARDGRLRVAVAVTFAPAGGLPRTEQRSVSV